MRTLLHQRGVQRLGRHCSGDRRAAAPRATQHHGLCLRARACSHCHASGRCPRVEVDCCSRCRTPC